MLAWHGHFGEELFPPDPVPLHWTAVAGSAIVLARGNALLLLSAERSERQLAALAQHDPLTGAKNRSGLEQAVTALARDGDHPRRAALLLVDIDHFKAINDGHGHDMGDEVLKIVAERLARIAEIRASVARIGGEEFALILPETNALSASKIAERCRNLVFKEQIPHAKSEVSQILTISVGAGSITPGPADDLKAFVESVDALMYQAKHDGRNRIVVKSA